MSGAGPIPARSHYFMPWDDADYYLLKKVKRLEAEFVFLSSRVANIDIIISAGGENIIQGEGNPNDMGIVPQFKNKPAVYQQIFIVGGVKISSTLWWWLVDEESWI